MSLSHSMRTIDHRRDYQIHFRSKLKLNICFAGVRGVYEAGPGCSAAAVVSIAHRPVFETNAADDIYFFSASLKSRSS
jgi:hypothetical protein